MASLRYSSVEVKVGIFVAFCGALFVAMLATYGRLVPVWRGRQQILAAFENVGALRADAPVRYNGVEVGRVKWLRILHLDDEALDCLPELTKRNLDNLPLRPESLKRELRGASDEDFRGRCREALRNRAMIQLCLEVLQEGDAKRYRLDDQVRVVTTVLGDTAVDITSGSGSVNVAGSKRMILGTTGDFFSNLAKSMGEVKEILSNVTDVVGAPERRSFVRAQARFVPIGERLDAIAALAQRRSDLTAKRAEALNAQVKKTLNDASGFPDRLRPQAEQTAKNAKAGFSAMEERFSQAQTEFEGASEEVAAELKPVREDVDGVIKQVRPQFEEMRTRIRLVYDLMGGLSRKTDGARDTAGRLYSESGGDLDRMLTAFKASLTNFEHVGQAATENKDRMLAERDKGEYEYNTAVDISRRLAFATRRIWQAGAELQEAEAAVSAKLAEEGPAAAPQAQGTLGRLAAAREPLDAVQQRVEELMLAPFPRKRSGWVEEAGTK